MVELKVGGVDQNRKRPDIVQGDCHVCFVLDIAAMDCNQSQVTDQCEAYRGHGYVTIDLKTGYKLLWIQFGMARFGLVTVTRFGAEMYMQ